ncbi:branched-chain amino acid ABC transporter permease [Pseudorhodoferax sp.]|uniref:branched-chain amino acid ABC transporter permease n=1 Tax=Pseudorhodoferax sp. TaxID=1993553 RepID=UPI0039E2DB9B
MDWQLLGAQVLAGIANGALYFLVASGLTLLWGALGVVNLAHGSLFMVAAFGAALCIQQWGTTTGLAIALIVVPIAVALGAMALEMTLFRPIYVAGVWGQLLISFGLVLVINNLSRMAFGVEPQSVSPPPLLSGAIALGPLRLPSYQLAVVLTAALVALYLWVILGKSRTGRLIRAAVDDPKMLEAVGVDVRRLRTRVMGIAALLAGIAGVIAAPRGAINLQMDVSIVVIAFAIIVVGGLGAVWGALAAAMLIGVAETVSTMFIDRGGEIVIFMVMVLVLLARPTGFKTIAGRD